ncbi:MAG: hypothetical protein ACI8P3_003325 [Saprospiraceae bacterium]|jgi:hypothetical protein
MKGKPIGFRSRLFHGNAGYMIIKIDHLLKVNCGYFESTHKTFVGCLLFL